MKRLIQGIYSLLFQKKTSSFAKHHAQYIEPGKLEKERAGIEENFRRKEYDNEANRSSKILACFHNRELCIDIGSGNGWYSAYMSQFFKRVEGIEPSPMAIELAKQLYPKEKYPHLSWNNGFAEDVLDQLPIDKYPTLFITGCVLSHLRDKEVAKICKIVNQKSKVGSALSWSECWGEKYHRFMWHVRTEEWWQKHLSNWEIDFHGGEIENVPGRHKGFQGIKVR